MKGFNKVMISGIVSESIFDKTKNNGTDCCSFKISVESRSGFETTVRCNVYGPVLVEQCHDYIANGCYVIVEGHLMQRGINLTEVRVEKMVFVPTLCHNDEERVEIE